MFDGYEYVLMKLQGAPHSERSYAVQVRRYYADMRGTYATRVWYILCGGSITPLIKPFKRLTSSLLQLLAIVGVGFTQGLFALDAADGERDESGAVRYVVS